MTQQEALRTTIVRTNDELRHLAVAALYETEMRPPVYEHLFIDQGWLRGQQMIVQLFEQARPIRMVLAPGLPTITVDCNEQGVRVTQIFNLYLAQYEALSAVQRNQVEVKLHDVLLRAKPTELDFIRFTNQIGRVRNPAMARVVESHGGSLLANTLKMLIKGAVLKNKIIRNEPTSPYGRLPGGMPDGPTIMVHLGGVRNNHPHGTSQKIQDVLHSVSAGNAYRHRQSAGTSK